MSDDADDKPFGRSGITVKQLTRVARLYRQNSQAAAVLGIATRSFSRLCREHGIETPWARERRRSGN